MLQTVIEIRVRCFRVNNGLNTGNERLAGTLSVDLQQVFQSQLSLDPRRIDTLDEIVKYKYAMPKESVVKESEAFSKLAIKLRKHHCWSAPTNFEMTLGLTKIENLSSESAMWCNKHFLGINERDFSNNLLKTIQTYAHEIPLLVTVNNGDLVASSRDFNKEG